jgi:hypothetical protein
MELSKQVELVRSPCLFVPACLSLPEPAAAQCSFTSRLRTGFRSFRRLLGPESSIDSRTQRDLYTNFCSRRTHAALTIELGSKRQGRQRLSPLKSRNSVPSGLRNDSPIILHCFYLTHRTRRSGLVKMITQAEFPGQADTEAGPGP